MQTGAGCGKSLLETAANPSNVGSVSNTQNPPTETNGTHAPSNRPRTENGTVDGPPTWSIEKSTELYQIRGWGEPLLPGQRQRLRRGASGSHARAKHRPFRAHAGPSRARSRAAAAHPLPGHPARPHPPPERVLRRAPSPSTTTRASIAACYPVKVNQQRHVVEEVVEFGAPVELRARGRLQARAAHRARQARRVGRPHHLQRLQGSTSTSRPRSSRSASTSTVIVVLERIEELDMVFRASEKLGIAPVARRARQAHRARASGAGPTRRAIARSSVSRQRRSSRSSTGLRERDMLDCLQLLHFHIGSQISSIIPIKNAMREAANIYVELAKMGATMRYLDVGGGLAVDYDGSKTDFHASKNYTMQEYANDVVATIQEACIKAASRVPDDRDRERAARSPRTSRCSCSKWSAPTKCASASPTSRQPNAHRVLRGLYETWKSIDAEERPGGVPRRQPGQGRSAEPLQVRLPRPARARAGRAPLLELLREDPTLRARA